MNILWFSYGSGVFPVFPVYDYDTVAISRRLRGKARLGKQLGCRSGNYIKNIANTSKPVLEEAGDESKSYQIRIKFVLKSYQNRIQIVSKPYPNRNKIINRKEIVRKS